MPRTACRPCGGPTAQHPSLNWRWFLRGVARCPHRGVCPGSVTVPGPGPQGGACGPVLRSYITAIYTHYVQTGRGLKRLPSSRRAASPWIRPSSRSLQGISETAPLSQLQVCVRVEGIHLGPCSKRSYLVRHQEPQRRERGSDKFPARGLGDWLSSLSRTLAFPTEPAGCPGSGVGGNK